MKVTYDKEADAVYIYLKNPIKRGEAKKNVPTDAGPILDFDKKGKLLGIEILWASKVFDKKVLEKFERIDLLK